MKVEITEVFEYRADNEYTYAMEKGAVVTGDLAKAALEAGKGVEVKGKTDGANAGPKAGDTVSLQG